MHKKNGEGASKDAPLLSLPPPPTSLVLSVKWLVQTVDVSVLFNVLICLCYGGHLFVLFSVLIGLCQYTVGVSSVKCSY